MKEYILAIIVFITGAVVMVVEILAFGIIAPHFGIALTVSSNIIGIILLSLAIGYFLGGKLADRKAEIKTLSLILFISGIYITGIALFKDAVGIFFKSFTSGVAASSFWTIIVLFLPVNILLGMILPYVLKLSVKEISTSGRKSGFIYFLSAAGSIAGVFLTAFILIPFLGVEISLIIAVVLLFVLAIITAPIKKIRIFAISVFVLVFFAGINHNFAYDGIFAKKDGRFSIDGSVVIDKTKLKKLADVNSQYSRVEILEGIDEKTKRTIRLMRVNKELHSGTFIDSNELVFNYTKFNRLAGHFNPDAKKALLIGGGGYTYAKYFLGDTPLHDVKKIWTLNGEFFDNDNTVSVPILTSYNAETRSSKRVLVFKQEEKAKGSELEGLSNKIDADNQFPGEHIVVRNAEIKKTGFDAPNGFIHIHEVRDDGTLGKVISPDYPINAPSNVIGHSDLITGENKDVRIKLDRKTREGESIYAMLHRDNGNKKFDPILVDGYSKIEQLDVVEIDPVVTDLAVKYFGLDTRDPRLRIFHEDGRTYINRTDEKYGIVYIDAFRSFYSIPYQLTTLEAMQRFYDILDDNGILLINAPSALKGEFGKFFQAELKTVAQIFPDFHIYAVSSPNLENSVQSLIIIAFKSKDDIRTFLNSDPEINKQLEHRWYGDIDKDAKILTDEFAPVDYYINNLINIPTM